MAKELFLEIGTEEIPAAFLPKAIADMEEMIRKELTANRIRHGTVKAVATPRRLALCVTAVAERQEDQLIEKLGPARKVAYDEQGNPTKAALGFARGQGIDISEVEIISTDKGEYIGSRKKLDGEETKKILPAILPKFILSIPFKKSMRWMNLEIRFARPIHWIVALYGSEVVPFRIENIASGNASRGHRFMAPKPFKVKGFRDYLTKTRKRFVLVDPEERRRILLEEARTAAANVGGKILENEALVQEVSFLVEYPSAVLGNFEKEYLKLPKDVLTTTMISHQKYFPVVDASGNLMAHFVTINNTVAKDPAVVARGNEKVIRARLADAKFFFEEDQKIPLMTHFEELKKVVFHSALGTSYDKVMQFRELAAWIADRVNPALKDTVDRTALLSKADLETKMVYEFPELQGIMGREYALIQGENPVVARAVYEHYMPTSGGGDLPETEEGSIVSIADKTDTITGFFGINVIPTGTADPYALRRQALGMINIILNKQYPLELPELVDRSIAIQSKKLKRTPEETKKDVMEFFKARFSNQLVSQGRPYDVVDAVLATGLTNPVQAIRKIEAVEATKGNPDFEPLAVAFKRVGNILKDFKDGCVDPVLFENEAEQTLYNTYIKIRKQAEALIGMGNYKEALLEMVRLRKPVDAFFEAVLVMAKDEKVKFNRLSLLEAISKLFHNVADFSKIVTEK